MAALAAARKLLVIGADFTFTHPVAGIRLRQAVAAGARMLLIDPFDTLLGHHASWWLRPPPAGVPALLEALAGALAGDPGVRRLASLVKEMTGLEHPAWPQIIDWLRDQGQVTIALQKAPGGLQGRVRRAVTLLTEALAGPGWQMCYIPLDADGHGVPLSIGAAGFRSGEERLEELLSGHAVPSLALFLRADPLGESWRRPEWEAFRERTGCWVACDPFLTATASRADLVLPLPHFLEGRGTVLAAGGPGDQARLWDPPAGVVPLRAVLAELAATLGRDGGEFRRPFAAAAMRRQGMASLRRALAGESRETPAEAPVPAAGKGEYLLSIRFHRFPGHRLRLMEARRIIGPAERLELNPADAGRLGLGEGDRAAVLLDGGRFIFSVTMTPRVPRGQIALPFDPEFELVGGLLTFIGRRGFALGPVVVRLEKG